MYKSICSVTRYIKLYFIILWFYKLKGMHLFVDFQLLRLIMNQPQHTCSTCQKCFTTKYDLTRHIRTVHNKEQATCDQCGKTFGRKDNLIRHISQAHGTTAPATFNCESCPLIFERQDLLIQHIKRKHSDKQIRSGIY